jgi:hypothetical protein
VLKVGERQAVTLEGVRSTFTVPTADWVSNGSFGIDKSAGTAPDGAGFILWTDTPVGVFSDPCAEAKGPVVGSSVGSLADAVASIPSIDVVESPVDVTVGGQPAKKVVVTIPEDIGCEPDSFFLWYAPTVGMARYATAVGSTIRTWIVDVDGTTIWFDAETYKGAGPEPGQEIQAIVDSMRFE